MTEDSPGGQGHAGPPFPRSPKVLDRSPTSVACVVGCDTIRRERVASEISKRPAKAIRLTDVLPSADTIQICYILSI